LSPTGRYYDCCCVPRGKKKKAKAKAKLGVQEAMK
jgi:hypothetical protein